MIPEPDSSKLDEWREKYGSIFSIDDGNTTYIFRPLTFREYDMAISMDDRVGSVAAEDHIVFSCVLHPPLDEASTKSMKTGIFGTLSSYILDLSGFGDVQSAIRIMEESRSKMEEIKYLMFNFIVAALNYTHEDLMDLNFKEVAEKVAAAEKVIEMKQQINNPGVTISFDIYDPNATEDKSDDAPSSGSDPIAERLKQALG